MLILRKAGIDVKRIFVNIEGTADISGFIIAFMDKRKAGFSLFHGIHQQTQAEQYDADGQKQFFSHDKNRHGHIGQQIISAEQGTAKSEERESGENTKDTEYQQSRGPYDIPQVGT